MRPWVLVYLCSIGVVGGSACSARSLLAITLTSGDGSSVMGYPRITVARDDGTLVKEVDKTDGGDSTALLILDNGVPLEIGVYLPSDTDGAVRVSVAIVATTGSCELSGAAAPVNVHGGDRTPVDIVLRKTATSGECSSTPSDAGSEDGASSDGEVGADGMNDASVANTVAACIAYCAAYVEACASWGPDQPTCVSMCDVMSWQIGTGDAATGENSFGCRMRHLRAAADAALDCSECYAASPESAGICGPPVDGAVRGACPNG